MAENSIHVRKRGFHLGIRTKIMIPVILTNIFIGVVLSVVIMDDFKKQCIETGAQGALSIVTLAEARINGDTIQKLAEEGSDSSSYILVYNSIEDIVDSVGVERIYTVGYDPSGNLCHLVDIRKDESEGIEIYSRGKRKTSYHCNSTDKNKVRRSNRCGIYRI